jgi:2-C-methyl-D-erythritol 4-phosphate cytidylyltransferase
MIQNAIQNNIIIVAGGKGLRMGEPIPKQFLPIGSQPILMHTIKRFFKFQSNMHIILVLPEHQKDYWKGLCETFQFKIPHTIASGGTTRFNSVLNGLSHIHNTKGLTGVHDGVRPFVSQGTIANCYAKAKDHGAAIPIIPLVDSIRELEETSSWARPRNNYCLVQTPQVFKTDWLVKAYQQAFNEAFTDDASVVEAAGYKVQLTMGNPENIKITSPFDMVVAQALAEKEDAQKG